MQVGHKCSKEDAAGEDHVSPAVIPRCVLVTGIPLASRGLGLKRLLVGIVQSAFKGYEGEERVRPTITFKYNVNGNVRDGISQIIFETPALAASFLAHVAQLPSPPSYDDSPLRFTFGASTLRDHFFPTLSFKTRRTMSLDPVATFSVTGEVASVRMAMAILAGCWPAVAKANNLEDAHTCAIADVCAGVGGNSIGIARAALECGTALSTLKHTTIHAVELDPKRCEMLTHNVKLAIPEYAEIDANAHETVLTECSVKVTAACGACVETVTFRGCAIAHVHNRKEYDVVFFDPPWGGTDYASKGEMCLDVQSAEGTSSLSLADAILTLSRAAPIVATKLPASMNITQLATAVTEATRSRNPKERDFPILLHFDATMVLFVVIRNPFRDVEESDGSSGNMFLDQIVAHVNDWHGKGTQSRVTNKEQLFSGGGVCRPEFYDFEKQRWIQMKKWIPTTDRMNPATN